MQNTTKTKVPVLSVTSVPPAQEQSQNPAYLPVFPLSFIFSFISSSSMVISSILKKIIKTYYIRPLSIFSSRVHCLNKLAHYVIGKGISYSSSSFFFFFFVCIEAFFLKFLLWTLFFHFIKKFFIYFNWRIIALQYFVDFCYISV